MTEKQTTDRLDLRAGPRPRIVRFRRGVVIGATALASGVLIGITMIALHGPISRGPSEHPELYDTGKKPTADGLAALPGDYSQVKQQTPVLGPPLPGDLGVAIVAHQRESGVNPSAEDQRLASQALHARESGVLFRVDNRPEATTAEPSKSATAATSQPQNDRLTLDPERDQNDQQRKLDFVHQRDATGIYNPHALQTPASPYEVMAGSIIAASLITGVNSDLPGLVVAQVTENVYDTATGRTLLIPQGTRLIGAYDSVVAFGQSRALLVWQRLILPDGSSIQIDNLPATDAAGYTGLEDEVDYHTWTLLKGVALSTLLGVGSQVGTTANQNDLIQALRQSTLQTTNQAGQRIVEKDLNIQPTITIRPGWPVRIIVHKDLILKAYQGN
ncbi:type IV secretion system protein virB10 [mine drainage metagenome]|uniref:Type IV secretion system protein virB10 n=1 Tax=mine drainage metagenome TaxID=410659 RepID=A0A1J5RX36_9ZZZZ